MLLFARVPHSSVLYIETELKVANFSLKVCREPWDEALLGHAVLKPLQLPNYASIINSRGAHPRTVNVATV